MSDVIETTETTEEEQTYPKPNKVYVRKGRCTYCGSKKIKTLYGYEWCNKTCGAGALGLKLYEETYHLGAYAKNDADETESE